MKLCLDVENSVFMVELTSVSRFFFADSGCVSCFFCTFASNIEIKMRINRLSMKKLIFALGAAMTVIMWLLILPMRAMR